MIKIRLTQDAYLALDKFGDDIYKAEAIDDNGTEYEVIWAILDSYKVMTDDDQANREDEACDWEKPTKVINLDTFEDVTDEVAIVRQGSRE